MAYWLLKSEPASYSIDDLLRDKRTHWNGVRNFQARNNLKLMKLKDLCLVYHSGEDKAVVGVAELVREAYPDSSATEGDWVMVDLQFKQKLRRPVTLSEIKKVSGLKDIALIKQSRLSVMPLTLKEFEAILKMSEGA